jgi:TetR/AcrR family transcriptional repressor of nem operon
MMARSQHESKRKILDAALMVIRAKGYSATTVDDICAAAGLTKGSFFYHFKGKDDLAVAAADYWSEMTGALFDAAPYHAHADPFDRVLGYIDFRKAILRGAVAEFTCLVGTMVQETYDTHPSIRAACERSIREHAAKVETDIADAMRMRGIAAEWTAASLALYTQAVLQGAFILAKATQSSEIAIASLGHLRNYLVILFGQSPNPKTRSERA